MSLDKDPNQVPVRLVDPEDPTYTNLDPEVYQDGFDKEGEPDGVSNFREETAAEFPAPQAPTQEKRDADQDESVGSLMNGRALGTFSITLAILSLFFLPLLLGSAGIIVGFIAQRGDSKVMGRWAIGIGVVSIITSLFFSTII
ncbi:DUF4190 domain-containing protein [Alkalicoccobacillus murimartini]|uniref:DUF4190 domain-containing protein n=1 Tax=Alkalicoccobacillus murimartini TaxID=171685 RepID=A0ABT9YEE0_9BACI|nr:DUF4190 domain-containing protein [Alkalicoccobacillus murimartini]MDQ0205572.1 hypothetical protein [Alkalicoccobacillus murimartini]